MLTINKRVIKQVLFVVTLFFFVGCQGQSDTKFNLGFEEQKDIAELSDGWFKWGNYELAIDSLSKTGQKSGKICSTESGTFGSIAYQIPAKYIGESIKLEGYMKIKNVENGFAGLLLRIDGKGSSLAFDNMMGQEVNGTKDWRKYSITLDYPKGADLILVGGILTGKGEAWFDDFKVTIDGENLQTLKELDEETLKKVVANDFGSNSGVEIAELSPDVINDLELLGKVWGFLKYHHPKIAKGDFNWDLELFRFLPSYLKEVDRAKREELILNWITSLGEIKKTKNKMPSSEAHIKPNLNWIKNDVESSLLKEKLNFIYENRNKGKHHYIKMAKGVGNPEFQNEEAYSNVPYPDAGFRLLSVYRYWNMIHYFFPYKNLIDKDWNEVLKEYIPVFISAKDELEYEMAALQMIGDIQDTHANLWKGNNKLVEWKGNYFAPVHLRFIEDKLVVTDYYNPEFKSETGLEIGDVISKIDGKRIEDIVDELSKYYPASNQAARLREMAADLLRSNKQEVEVEYLNNGKLATKTIKLYPRQRLNIYRWYKKNEDRCYKLLENNIGYVSLMSIKEEDIDNIKHDFKDTKGIVIDIRNYPSTFVPFKLGSFFISDSAPFVKFTQGNINNPGEFTFTENLKIHKSKETYTGKLIVLVNELSQSQAEYTAMAFRAGDNTIIIGSTTAGADGNVSAILLPGGLQTMISGIGVFYPNGEETQRIGIVPDIEIKPTIKGIKEGRDELMEKAIVEILKE